MTSETLTKKISSLTTGTSFTVSTSTDRKVSMRIAKTLKDSGAIKTIIVSRRKGKGFVVAAI